MSITGTGGRYSAFSAPGIAFRVFTPRPPQPYHPSIGADTGKRMVSSVYKGVETSWTFFSGLGIAKDFSHRGKLSRELRFPVVTNSFSPMALDFRNTPHRYFYRFGGLGSDPHVGDGQSLELSCAIALLPNTTCDNVSPQFASNLALQTIPGVWVRVPQGVLAIHASFSDRLLRLA